MLKRKLETKDSVKSKATHVNRFVSNPALVQDSIDDALDRRLKEHRHVRSQEHKLAESYIAIWVVIPRSAKFDILRFVGIPEPDFRSFVEAGGNAVEVRQKHGILEVT